MQEKKKVKAKKKKIIIVKIAKEKKRVETKTLAWKKIDYKAVKNIEIVLEKIQISKHKAVLLASNLFSKKKSQKTKNTKKPIIKLNFKPE